MDRPTPSRRRFLALTAAGSGLSVAGCSELEGDPPAATDGETEADGGARRQATLFVEPDQEALQEARTRITQQVQDGNLSQQEAQRELAAAQEEIVADAVGEVESAVSDGTVTIEDSRETRGALLMAGPATGLIDLLSHDAVGGLVDAATFDEMQTQG